MYKLLLICLFVSSTLNAQISEEWRRFYNGTGSVDDEGVKIIADNSGNSYVACYFGVNPQMSLVKYDVNGNQVWLRTYTEPGSESGTPADMKFDNDGDIVIVGTIQHQSGTDIMTLKLEPVSGNEIWRANTNTPTIVESPAAMCIDNLGNICITGSIYDSGSYDMLTIKYTSSGSLIFSRSFNGSWNTLDLGRSVTTDNSRNVYVIGQANYAGSNSDFILIKYGPGGNTLWGRYFDSGNNMFDWANEVLVDNSNNIILSGNAGYDMVTLKYSSIGDLLWEKRYSKTSTSNDRTYRLKIDELNNIYVFGKSLDTLAFQTLIKYDSNGTQQFATQHIDDYNNFRGFLFFDKTNNIYTVTSWDTVFSSPDTSYVFVKITKFNSAGIFLHDSLYSSSESVNFLSDAYCDKAGNLYLTGSTSLFQDETRKDVISVKYDLSGNYYWQQVVRGDGTGSDFSKTLKLKRGSLYVCGTGAFGKYNSFTALKYRTDGELLWRQEFNRHPGVFDNLQASAIDNNSNVLLTGFTQVATNNRDFVTVKYDSNGVLKWYRDYGGPTNDQSAGITHDTDGNIYVTGTVTNSPGGIDWATIKYDQDGNQLWVSQHNGGASGPDYAYDIALGIENDVYVCGSSNESSSGNDAALIKYDNAGNQVWVRKFTGSGVFTDELKKIRTDELGNIYVSGTTYSASNKEDYLLLKFDKEGNQLWQQTYNGTGTNSDKVNDMTIFNDKVIITGESLGLGTILDYMTIEYDSSGNQLWTARYNGSLNRSDKAYAIETDADGNIYVTGESTINIGNLDITTIKYDSQGNQKLVLQYSGTANTNDTPSDIAVSENGEVYVCGSTYLLSNNSDIVTLKYSKSVGINVPSVVLPDEFILYDNYPNPFNPNTIIQFDIPVDSRVELKIYDITGREIRTLINEFKKAGHYSETFDGTNLTSGVYVYRLTSRYFVKSKLMVLIK